MSLLFTEMHRGYFMETYNSAICRKLASTIHFVQDNQSMSTKGVLRGLHFQKEYPQAKLVRAVRGSVFDVAVDLKKRFRNLWKVVGVDALSGE